MAKQPPPPPGKNPRGEDRNPPPRRLRKIAITTGLLAATAGSAYWATRLNKPGEITPDSSQTTGIIPETDAPASKKILLTDIGNEPTQTPSPTARKPIPPASFTKAEEKKKTPPQAMGNESDTIYVPAGTPINQWCKSPAAERLIKDEKPQVGRVNVEFTYNDDDPLMSLLLQGKRMLYASQDPIENSCAETGIQLIDKITQQVVELEKELSLQPSQSEFRDSNLELTFSDPKSLEQKLRNRLDEILNNFPGQIGDLGQPLIANRTRQYADASLADEWAELQRQVDPSVPYEMPDFLQQDFTKLTPGELRAKIAGLQVSAMARYKDACEKVAPWMKEEFGFTSLDDIKAITDDPMASKLGRLMASIEEMVKTATDISQLAGHEKPPPGISPANRR
jgi:hypothetical protein